MLATENPPAASVTSAQLLLSMAKGQAQSVATIGLRRNLYTWNPSMGASFQAPPAAINQPPIPASATNTPVGNAASKPCAAAPVQQMAINPSATDRPTQ